MSSDPTTRWVPAYGTNGFGEHTLEAALDVMQHTGYRALGLTLGTTHFDPFADDWRERAEALAADLARRGFRVAVETGSPIFSTRSCRSRRPSPRTMRRRAPP